MKMKFAKNIAKKLENFPKISNILNIYIFINNTHAKKSQIYRESH